MLGALALLLFNLPNLFKLGLGVVTAGIGVIGFLTYGPYSLLAGVFSVEVGGKKSVGAVSGMVDGVGYLAGILAGAQFGRLVDYGGYRMGFQALAGLAAFGALLCFLLTKPKETETQAAG
jgi:sugar phosphate permease